MAIPKLLHFIWAGGMKLLPEENINIIKAWRDKNPDFQIIVWIDKQTTPADELAKYNNIYQFDKLNIALKDITEAGVADEHIRYEIDRIRPNYGASSDLLRYNILAKFGGAYFDSDVLPGKKRLNHNNFFDKTNEPIFLINQNSQNTGHIGNDAFICTPNHPLMLNLAKVAHQNYIAPLAHRPNVVYGNDDFEYMIWSTVYRTGPNAVVQTFIEAGKMKRDDTQAPPMYHIDPEIAAPLNENHRNWIGVPAKRSTDKTAAIVVAVQSILFEAKHMGIIRLEDHVKDIAESIDLPGRTSKGTPLPSENEIAQQLVSFLDRLATFGLFDLSQITKVQIVNRYQLFNDFYKTWLPVIDDGKDLEPAEVIRDLAVEDTKESRRIKLNFLNNAFVNMTYHLRELSKSKYTQPYPIWQEKAAILVVDLRRLLKTQAEFLPDIKRTLNISKAILKLDNTTADEQKAFDKLLDKIDISFFFNASRTESILKLLIYKLEKLPYDRDMAPYFEQANQSIRQLLDPKTTSKPESIIGSSAAVRKMGPLFTEESMNVATDVAEILVTKLQLLQCDRCIRALEQGLKHIEMELNLPDKSKAKVLSAMEQERKWALAELNPLIELKVNFTKREAEQMSLMQIRNLQCLVNGYSNHFKLDKQIVDLIAEKIITVDAASYLNKEAKEAVVDILDKSLSVQTKQENIDNIVEKAKLAYQQQSHHSHDYEDNYQAENYPQPPLNPKI